MGGTFSKETFFNQLRENEKELQRERRKKRKKKKEKEGTNKKKDKESCWKCVIMDEQMWNSKS